MNDNIVKYTNIWYDYVGMDHHKDRDCHFYIECAYSYGMPPVYYAYHNGYRMHDWKGPVRKTFAEAEKDLENKLRNEINTAILETQERLDKGDSWTYTDEDLNGELRALKGKRHDL